MNNPRSALWTTGLCVPLISIGIPKKVPSSRLVELPRQPFGDGRLYGYQNRAGDHPDNALRLWQRFFNDLYAESAAAPMFTTFHLHPYVSSRLARTSALKEMIEYMKGHEGVWFASEAWQNDMRIATATLRKDIRIMRTPEDSIKPLHQVFWNKKFTAMLDHRFNDSKN